MNKTNKTACFSNKRNCSNIALDCSNIAIIMSNRIGTMTNSHKHNIRKQRFNEAMRKQDKLFAHN
jgi:hypothetical protein